MTGGSELAGAPLAHAVSARWSWRPGAVQGAQRLLGTLAARRAPILEAARSLQAWHDGLAQRWRPLEMTPMTETMGVAAPASAAGISAWHDPGVRAGAVGGAPGPEAGRRGPAAPVRSDPARRVGSRAQPRPAAVAPSPARPALKIAALAAPGATFGAPLLAAAAREPGSVVLGSAIGRRFARREVAGGFPAAPPHGPGNGAEVAGRPAAPLVRWRVVDGGPADQVRSEPGAMRRASIREGEANSAPALPALRAEPSLLARRGDPIPDRRAPGSDVAERPGAPAAVPLPLSVRLVPREEAASRLAASDDTQARRDDPQSARSELGARRDVPPAPAIDIDGIVERVQRELKRREQFERERKGLF